jgi:hypothetical protein
MSEPLPAEAIAAVPAAAYTALGVAIQAYEPEAAVLITRSPSALLQILLEAGRRAVVAAAPAIQSAERERIYAALGPAHYVIFTEDGWTVEHSVECRLSGHMPHCEWLRAVRRVAAEPRAEMMGRWRIDGIDGAGLPSLARIEGDAP